MSGIAESLERIAFALETMADDARERRREEQDAIRAQLRLLHDRSEEADEHFAMADQRVIRLSVDDPRGLTGEVKYATAQAAAREQEAIAAARAYQELSARHPRLAEEFGRQIAAERAAAAVVAAA